MGGAKTNEPAFNKVKLWFYVIAGVLFIPVIAGRFALKIITSRYDNDRRH